MTGDTKQAYQAYDRALPLFEQVNDRNGYTFFHRGLGDLALQTGDYARAHKQFLLSLERAQAVGHQWGAAYAMYGIGRAATGLGEYGEALEWLKEALEASRNVWHNGLTLLVLSGAANLFGVHGDREQAVVIAAFVSGHVNTWYEVRNRMQALLTELAAEMEPAAFEAAEQRARSMQLDDFQL